MRPGLRLGHRVRVRGDEEPPLPTIRGGSQFTIFLIVLPFLLSRMRRLDQGAQILVSWEKRFGPLARHFDCRPSMNLTDKPLNAVYLDSPLLSRCGAPSCPSQRSCHHVGCVAERGRELRGCFVLCRLSWEEIEVYVLFIYLDKYTSR